MIMNRSPVENILTYADIFSNQDGNPIPSNHDGSRPVSRYSWSFFKDMTKLHYNININDLNNKSLPRLRETHFGSSVNSTVVHSPIEVSTLSTQHSTPLTSNDGRAGKGLERGRRSVAESVGDDGGVRVPHNDGGVPHHHGGCDGGLPHNQLGKVRLFPLGPAAPINKMPHVQFRLNILNVFNFSLPRSTCRPNGTIFDCELGCFVPIEEYHRRRSKESLASVKEEMD